MTFNCSLTVSGMNPQQSAKAFIDSYNETSQLSYYKKFHNRLEQYFVNKVDRGISQFNIKDGNLKNSFSINFKGNNLEFISKNKNAIKYEHGYNKVPPKRYIQPAVFDTTNELSNIIISEAINAYDRKSKFGQGMIQTLNPNIKIQSNYFNKYSKMLK